jgi:hypothetical protein
LVVGKPGIGRRGDGADLPFGDDGAGDGDEDPEPARRQADRRQAARARCAGGPPGDRRARARAARRSLAQTWLDRDHRALRAELSPAVHRRGDHRRLSCAAARSQLLPPPAHRGAALATCPHSDRRDVASVRCAHPRFRHRRPPTLAPSDRARAGRADRVPGRAACAQREHGREALTARGETADTRRSPG